MKYNNTSFSKNACSNMTLSRFKLLYSDKLKGYDLRKVFAELGGKQPKKRQR